MGMCNSKSIAKKNEPYSEGAEWDKSVPTSPDIDVGLNEGLSDAGCDVPVEEPVKQELSGAHGGGYVPLNILNNSPTFENKGSGSVQPSALRQRSDSGAGIFWGISLAGIKSLLAQLQSDVDGDTITTRDLVDRVIRPQTIGHPRNRAFTNGLPEDHIDAFDTYVSHAWDMKARDLLRAVISDGEAHTDKGEAAPCYFIDIVCVDQHKTEQPVGSNDRRSCWVDAVSDQIKQSARMLVVASPFDAPIVASRVSCLVEAALASSYGVPIETTLPLEDESSLLVEIMDDNGHSGLAKMMTSVDSRHAKATYPSDCKALRTLIETEIVGSYQHVDELYKKLLREAIRKASERLRPNTNQNEVKIATFDAKMGHIFELAGDHNTAIAFHRSALESRQRLLDSSHPHIAESLNALGSVYQQCDDLANACEYHSRALKIRLEMLGVNDIAVAESYYALGSIRTRQDKTVEAVQLLRKALKIQLHSVGANSKTVAITYSALGTAFVKAGDTARGIKAFEKSLMVQLEILGDSCQEVVNTYQCLGKAHFSRSEYSESLWNFNEALRAARTAYGSGSAKVKDCLMAVANVCEVLKDYKESIKVRGLIITEQTKVHGSKEHHEVARSLAALANTLTKQGDLPGAADSFEQSLAIWTALKERTEEVASVYCSLADIYRRQSEFELALQSVEMAFSICRDTQPENNRTVASCHDMTFCIYRDQGDLERAVDALQAVTALRAQPGSISDCEALLETYRRLHSTFSMLGRDDEATSCHAKAHEIEVEMDNFPRANTRPVAVFPLSDDESDDGDDCDQGHAPTTTKVPDSSEAPKVQQVADRPKSGGGDSGHHSLDESPELLRESGLDGFIGDGYDSRRESPVMIDGIKIPSVPCARISRAADRLDAVEERRSSSPEYDGWGDEDSVQDKTSSQTNEPSFLYAIGVRQGERSRSNSYLNATQLAVSENVGE